MDLSIDYSQKLNDILTLYRNNNIEITKEVFIRASALASGIWGIHQHANYVARQIFPQSAEYEFLSRHGDLHGVPPRGSDEELDAYRTRVVDYFRNPAAGGTSRDYERWCEGITVVGPTEYPFSYAGGPESSTGTFTNFSSENLWDGNGATVGFSIAAGAGDVGKYFNTNLGSYNDLDLVRLTLYFSGACSCQFEIYGGDDYVPDILAGTFGVAAGGDGLASLSWPSIGAHRFWRVKLTGNPSAGVNVLGAILFVNGMAVRLAKCVLNSPGDVTVYVSSDRGIGKTSAILRTAAVTALVGNVPIASGAYRVSTSQPTMVAVGCTVYGACDLAAAQWAIAQYLLELRHGENYYRVALSSICYQFGASIVTVTSPATDGDADPGTLYRPGVITITQGS